MFELLILTKKQIFNIFVSSIVFIVIDSVYLNFIKDYFNNQVKLIQGSSIKINSYAMIICYIILIFGINYFIIIPNRSILDAFLLGLIIYGVYETTNMALFSKWSWTTVVIDTLWGGILFALTTTIIKMI
jgi:uncharacterized membrane protein